MKRERMFQMCKCILSAKRAQNLVSRVLRWLSFMLRVSWRVKDGNTCKPGNVRPGNLQNNFTSLSSQQETVKARLKSRLKVKPNSKCQINISDWEKNAGHLYLEVKKLVKSISQMFNGTVLMEGWCNETVLSNAIITRALLSFFSMLANFLFPYCTGTINMCWKIVIGNGEIFSPVNDFDDQLWWWWKVTFL